MQSPPVTFKELALGWHFGPSELIIAGVLTIGAIVYLRRVRALRLRNRRWRVGRTTSFLGGLATILLAVDSGIAHYENSVFSIHVIQHLLLMNLAPPLLALGAPVTLALQTSSRKLKTQLLAVLHSSIAKFFAYPVVGFLAAMATMYAYFLTSLYQLTIDSQPIHDLSHLVFLGVGCMYWWPIVSVDPIPRRLGFGARMGMVLGAIPFNAFLGIAIMNMSQSISSANTLADTHTGGGLLWGLGEFFTLGALAVLFVGWSREEERKALRQDKRDDAVNPAQARSAGAQLHNGEADLSPTDRHI